MGQEAHNKGKKDAYRHVVKYLGIFGGAHALSVVMNVLRTKVSSVLLGVEGQTIITLSTRTVQMFSDGTGLSLGFSAVRKISDVFENGDDVLGL